MIKNPMAQGNAYYQKLADLLDLASTKTGLYKTVVNTPFHDQLSAIQIDLGIVVLLLVNSHTHTIDRIALSDTYSAQGAVRMSAKPFNEIKIPVGYKGNLIADAITTQSQQQTEDWQYLFVPSLDASDAHFNQAGAGIECSIVQPFKNKLTGAMIFSFYQPLSKIGHAHREFIKYYAGLVAHKL